MTKIIGNSGDIVSDIREIAAMWDGSAHYCDSRGEYELSSRDKRLAKAMRLAADVLKLTRNPMAITIDELDEDSRGGYSIDELIAFLVRARDEIPEELRSFARVCVEPKGRKAK